MSYRLSAFVDEISDDLDEQIRVLKQCEISAIELRGVWGKHVLDLTEEEIRTVKARASDHGIGFSAIGSPIGKYALSGDLQPQLDDLRRALDYAQIVGAPYVRVFSFRPPDGDDPACHRRQVLDWLGKLVEVAESTSVSLAHENEGGIYGDTAERVLDIHQSLRSDSLVCAFDFANFVQEGERPYECWQQLQDHLGYFHIKDARADGTVVPAGEGAGDVRRILAEAFAAGFSSFLTLEPHLMWEESNRAKPKVDLFGTAARALHELLVGIGGASTSGLQSRC